MRFSSRLMGIQTLGAEGGAQQSPLLPLPRQSSWYSLTLDGVEDQLGPLAKPLGSMNLTELLASVPTTVPKKSRGMDVGNGPLESSFGVVRGLNEKMADEVWREIQQGEKMKNRDVVVKTERKPTLGEMTLEDFLVKEGSFAESSLGPVDAVTPQNYTQQMSLSPAPSLGARSDTPMSGRKRDTSDAIERSIERKLRRKIENRESAARSRARKQAYHNELVSKVSRFEVENMRLKKEKELENRSPDGPADEPRYQLRRTTSASF